MSEAREYNVSTAASTNLAGLIDEKHDEKLAEKASLGGSSINPV